MPTPPDSYPRRRGLVYVLAGLVLMVAGWMIYDGAHALTTGDYVTPSSGEYAGQLGPWASLVETLGVPPRSTGMKWFFVAFGATWCLALALYLKRRRSGYWLLLAFAVGSLWYAIPGTAFSLLQLALLGARPIRRYAHVSPPTEVPPVEHEAPTHRDHAG